jgi:hypothetical protein
VIEKILNKIEEEEKKARQNSRYCMLCVGERERGVDCTSFSMRVIVFNELATNKLFCPKNNRCGRYVKVQ